MSNVPCLTKDEATRLIALDEKLDWRVTTSIKEHFNTAGKIDDFANAATAEEKQTQMKTLRDIFMAATQAEAAFATLRSTNIFFDVARRVEDDSTLATHIPAGREFEQADVNLLDKCGLHGAAAVVKARIGLS